MTENEDAESIPKALPRLLEDMVEAAKAVRELARAQWQLLGAELRLARAAAWTLLVAMLLVTVFSVALGLTLLVLLGLALAHWFGSWIWALLALAGLLTLCLMGAFVLFRRCLHWLSLPGTRAQWHSLARESVAASSTRAGKTGKAGAPESDDGEASADEHTLQAD